MKMRLLVKGCPVGNFGVPGHCWDNKVSSKAQGMALKDFQNLY